MKYSLVILSLLSFVQFASSQTSITPLDCVEPFYHGVASGDPLDDAVIIWTRVTPQDFGSPVAVEWRMATDTSMSNIVNSGSLLTDNTKDFTVKVDVTGLQPDTYYYYEFTALGANSARGRTKTAPTGSVDSLRFAVVSCANLEAGYFNAYEAITEKNDVEAVLMLGDYIYEYEEGGYSPNSNVDRVFDPTNEILSLSDYRLRYSVYHMDRNLQRLHQNFPWICVWDDHESANDSWMDGAENHNSGEGLWSDRKTAAMQAYFEWLPIRPKAPGNYEIFRSFDYGNLVDLMMVDTRLHGREEQGVNESDPNRTMLGTDQYTWLTNELSSSTAQWKVLGNQVMFAPLTIFGQVLNGDAWDGYPAERQNVLDHISNNNIENFTVITGDIHTSWALDIENGSDNVGVEFVTPSITSPGAPINVGSVLMLENPHLQYVDLIEHGFVILDVNTNRIQADWFYVNTLDNFNDPSVYWATSYYSNDGQMQLQETTSASLPGLKYDVDLAPLCPRPQDVTGTEEVVDNIGLIAIYPNPAINEVIVQFAGSNNSLHTVEVLDLTGKQVSSASKSNKLGTAGIIRVDLQDLNAGTYLLKISDEEGQSVTKRFLKL
jgi:alkaline phosphatase D